MMAAKAGAESVVAVEAHEVMRKGGIYWTLISGNRKQCIICLCQALDGASFRKEFHPPLDHTHPPPALFLSGCLYHRPEERRHERTREQGE